MQESFRHHLYLKYHLSFFLFGQAHLPAPASEIVEKVAVNFCLIRARDTNDAQEALSQAVAPGSHGSYVATAWLRKAGRMCMVEAHDIPVSFLTVYHNSPIKFNGSRAASTQKMRMADP